MFIRHVVVFDAADIDVESAFWAAMFDGRVLDGDPRFHMVVDADGAWVAGVQHAPDHVPPGWPDDPPQQMHIDLHVLRDDASAMYEKAIALGARVLDDQSNLDDPDAQEGFRVHADPAGHPFCIGWGHPTHERLAAYLANLDD